FRFALAIGRWILAHFPWPMVFLIPSGAIAIMAVVDAFVVRDRPSQAGHADFATGDASSGDDTPVDWGYLVRRVFSHPVLVTIALAEFCTGFVRQGLLLYFTEFLKEVHHISAGSTPFWWAGTGITFGGIAGGLLCGVLSDRLFQSRRPPVAFLFYAAQIAALLLLGFAPSPGSAVFLIGFAC